MKHYDYKTVMFVQISVMSSPTAQMYCKAPLYVIEDFLVTVLLPHQVFHWPFFLATMVRFLHHLWVHIQFLFINSTHCSICCTL